MPEPLDLAAIRADLELVASRPAVHQYSDAYIAAQQAIVDDHLPALLDIAADHAALVAEHRALADRLRDAVAERDDARARLGAIRVAASALTRYFAGEGREIPAAIRNLADTSRPFPQPVPPTVWTVIDEAHVMSETELRAAFGSTTYEPPAEADPQTES